MKSGGNVGVGEPKPDARVETDEPREAQRHNDHIEEIAWHNPPQPKRYDAARLVRGETNG